MKKKKFFLSPSPSHPDNDGSNGKKTGGTKIEWDDFIVFCIENGVKANKKKIAREINLNQCKPVQYDDVSEGIVFSHQFNTFTNAHTSRDDIHIKYILKIACVSI